MKSEKRKMGQRGFTLIELLIVIALIGILAVALLSAINPLEQLRKGRDSARKADAAELLNSIERYYASFQCYPWDSATCDISVGASDVSKPYWGIPPTPVGEISVSDLIDKNELKSEFETRVSSAGNASYDRLFIYEDGYVEDNVAGQVRVCFEPESSTGRAGGLGKITNNITAPLTTDVCPATGYTGGDTYAAANCYICVPQ